VQVTAELQNATLLVHDEARHGTCVGVGSGHVEQAVEPSVVDEGVVVQEQHVSAGRGAGAEIAAPGETSIRPRLNDADAPSVTNDLFDLWGGTIQDDDHLVVGNGLVRLQRRETLIEFARRSISQDDHRHFGSFHPHIADESADWRRLTHRRRVLRQKG
jgi:hypothetical protein